jgi:ribose transport system ATP-binding protein
MFPPLPVPEDEIIFAVEGLSAPNGRFNEVTFEVRRGEIFGIAGLVGAGRTELVRAIAGADPIASGRIVLDGQDVTPQSPKSAIESGIVLIPEDRKLQGLVLHHAIEENIAYSNLESVSRGGWISARSIRDFAARNIEALGVKGKGAQNADEMSGGNQQKVVIAKWLARNPRVVLLDEPTRGIDVGARSSIYELIRDLAGQGVAVIVVSSDLEEVLGISNRIMVMAAGRQAGILDHAQANDISVMELATS